MAELPITPWRQGVMLQVGRLPLYQLPFTDSGASLLYELWVCLKWHTSMHTSDDSAHIEYPSELEHPRNHREQHTNSLETSQNILVTTKNTFTMTYVEHPNYPERSINYLATTQYDRTLKQPAK